MAISQCLPTSFKVDLLSGQQNFSALSGGPNTFKIALYTSSATLGATTTSYTGTTNEVTGTGYTAGGATLSISVAPTYSGTTAYISFANAVWTASTFTARGALIYNNTLAGKNAVAILDFGSDKTVTASTFTIVFPTADATNAVIRIP
jgi:hypothetical protein